MSVSDLIPIIKVVSPDVNDVQFIHIYGLWTWIVVISVRTIITIILAKFLLDKVGVTISIGNLQNKEKNKSRDINLKYKKQVVRTKKEAKTSQGKSKKYKHT